MAARHYWIDEFYDRVIDRLGFAPGAYAPSGLPEGGGESEPAPVALTLSNGSEGNLASIGEGGAEGASGSTNGEMEVIRSTNVMEWINENHFRNSLFGVVQAIGGALEIAGGVSMVIVGIATLPVGLPEAGIGLLVIAHGADNVVTGTFSFATGESSRTLTQVVATNALRSAGLDETSAGIGGLVIDIGLGVLGGIAAAKSAPKLATLFGTRSIRGGSAADDLAGTIRNVNPTGGRMNCVNCAIATDLTLAGHPASALNFGPRSIRVLEAQFGGTFQAVTGEIEIGSILSRSGSGTRGIVFGESLIPGEPGHVFNVINQNGVIRFLDGQTGALAIDNFSRLRNFRLLITHLRPT